MKLFKRLDDEANQLTEEDVTALTSGTLGYTINGLLEDAELGETLKSAFIVRKPLELK